MMGMDRFAALVDAYGSSPARWPDAEREAAIALMQSSPEARRLADEAGRLDRMLDMPETAPASRALEDRILASFAQRQPQPRPTLALFAPTRWLPAGAVACSLALGILAGLQAPRLAGLDEETLAQDAAARAMTASASDGDTWLGGVE